MSFKILTIILLLGALVVYPQKEESAAPVVLADANSCELNSLFVDGLRNSQSGSNKKVFVIVRKTNQTKKRYRERLLREVKGILLGYKGFAKSEVIFAEGEDHESQGRVEFYLGGELFFVALTNRKTQVCWDCCDLPD